MRVNAVTVAVSVAVAVAVATAAAVAVAAAAAEGGDGVLRVHTIGTQLAHTPYPYLRR